MVAEIPIWPLFFRQSSRNHVWSCHYMARTTTACSRSSALARLVFAARSFHEPPPRPGAAVRRGAPAAERGGSDAAPPDVSHSVAAKAFPPPRWLGGEARAARRELWPQRPAGAKVGCPRAIRVRRPQFSRTASAARRGSAARRSGGGSDAGGSDWFSTPRRRGERGTAADAQIVLAPLAGSLSQRAPALQAEVGPHYDVSHGLSALA
jgi:hypothetical protein